MRKPNLVIIHSFPTNSKVLGGLYSFLSDYFTVFPIDLPGFDVDVSPIKDISIASYAAYVQAELNKLSLHSYMLAGVSFGFCVANSCVVDERCKGILALAPYLNSLYLMKNPTWKRVLLACATGLGGHRRIYQSNLFQRYFNGKVNSGLFDLIHKTVDPYTFFETAKMLLNYKKEPFFHDKPYVLVINEKDTTIQGIETLKRFEALDKVCIIKTTLAHHPPKLSRAHFQRHLPKEEIRRGIDCKSVKMYKKTSI